MNLLTEKMEQVLKDAMLEKNPRTTDKHMREQIGKFNEAAMLVYGLSMAVGGTGEARYAGKGKWAFRANDAEEIH